MRINTALLGVAAMAALFVTVGCGPPSAGPSLGTFGPGTYMVNSDIAPGLYMTEPDGHAEYAARLDAGRNILSNVFADRVLIEVLPTDTFVEVSSGTLKPWAVRYIGPGMELDGVWLAGTEIGTGLYLITPDSGGYTYWETDTDINGEDIIDNDFTSGQTYMLVGASAKAVVIRGVWTQ